jgi:Family of unknown function (DUF6496)
MATKKTAKRNGPRRRTGTKSRALAGRYIKDEMRAMKHGSKHVKSRKQAIAVGFSEARRHGAHIPAPQ